MSSSLLRSRCARKFHIRWPGNGLPVERFGPAAAPLARVIRRWFRGSNPSAPLLTLNPKHMSRLGQETFDVSHLYRVMTPIFPEYGIGYTSLIRFPPGTKGGFYYHQPPTLPPLAGEMRFRICDEVSQFAKGKDLEVEIGEPWSIPLYKIVKSPYYNKIQDLILKEGFVDPGLIADIEKMAGEGTEPKKKGTAIYDIEQPFVVNLSATSLRLRLNTRTCVRIVRFRPFTIFRAMNGPQFRPFGGRIKARFELHKQNSKAEFPELRLRFLKALTPITHTPPDGLPIGSTIVEPRPGELLMRGRSDRKIKPWFHPLSLTSQYGKILREFLAERALEKKKYGI